MKSLLSLTYCVVLLFLYGCASYQEELTKFDKFYYEETPKKAFEFSKKFSQNDLLWQIQNGVSAFDMGDYKTSLQVLGIAEENLNKFQSQNILASSLSNTGSVLLNDNVKPYEGSIYEGVMINYYKALDALSLGDIQNARIEFNRANDRQRRAKEYYEKSIQKATKELNKDKKSSLNTSKDKIDSILNAQYSNLKSFKIYDGFINPLISYVSGLFFSLQRDSKGIDLLKQSYGMNPSKTIGSDILLFQNHKQLSQKYTWILIEDGKSATKREFRFELPILLLDGRVYYFGIALPQLQDGKDFYRSFELRYTSKLKGDTSKNFEELALLDGIIANEFSKQLPFILTRAIISATYKVILQNTLNQNAGALAGLMGAIFSQASTSADTRITTVFPHKAWLIRIQNTPKKFYLSGDGKDIFAFELIDCSMPSDPKNNSSSELKVCKNSNNLIYLRTTKNNIISKLLIGEKNED